MSSICVCDESKLFPRCDRNGDEKCSRVDATEKVSGFATGKWSDDDDWHPITPFISPIR